MELYKQSALGKVVADPKAEEQTKDRAMSIVQDAVEGGREQKREGKEEAQPAAVIA